MCNAIFDANAAVVVVVAGASVVDEGAIEQNRMQATEITHKIYLLNDIKCICSHGILIVLMS